MTTVTVRNLICGVALLGALGSATSLHAQIGVGTWVKKATPTAPAMAMTVEACCGGGRRLIYHIDMKGTKMTLMLESAFDGKEVPVTIDGKPSAETMAIKRIDSHHLSNVLKMNGKPFGTSLATLSADGKTLTVVTDATSPAGGMAVGKTTEIWLLK